VRPALRAERKAHGAEGESAWRRGRRATGKEHGAEGIGRSAKSMAQIADFRFLMSVFSPAAGQKNGRSNRERNSEKANPPKADKYRISNNEYRMSK